MKKRYLLTFVLLIFCLLMTGCGGKEGGQDVPEDPGKQEQTPTGNDPAKDPAADPAKDPAAALADPVLEWWELYNPNGFDTVTAVISNPNDVAVDVSYDLVYCKDGAEVARSEGYANFSIAPGGRSVIWGNFDIPKSTDVNDVRMENITVTEAYAQPINGKYEYIGTENADAWFEFTFDTKPELATITFLLYNDENQNKHFDKGEIVVVSTDSLMEQSGRVSFETDVFSYTDYEVFFTAY